MEENIKWHLENENSIEFSTQTHKCYFNKRMQVGWLDRFQAFWYKIRKLKWRLSGNVLKIFDIGEQHTLAIKLIVRVFFLVQHSEKIKNIFKIPRSIYSSIYIIGKICMARALNE